MNPAAAERTTALTALLEARETVLPRDPAGVIFHVSRCGSTLIANILKMGDGCVVMSEAHPIGLLFQSRLFTDSPFPSENREEIRKLLLDCVVRLYAAAFGSHLVIKCHAASILQISRMRSVWPNVPFIILIRDPIEVMVSNLARPSGWLRSMQRPVGTGNIFRFTDAEIRQMTMEQYCARGLGKFFEAAIEQFGKNCWVLDYAKLSIRNIYRVSELFNISLPASDSPEVRQALLSYSKDGSGSRSFENDRELKQREATPSVRDYATQWAQKPYEILRKGGTFPLNVL
jgi:hypothetical protein